MIKKNYESFTFNMISYVLTSRWIKELLYEWILLY